MHLFISLYIFFDTDAHAYLLYNSLYRSKYVLPSTDFFFVDSISEQILHIVLIM